MNLPEVDSIECAGCEFLDTWWETPTQRLSDCHHLTEGPIVCPRLPQNTEENNDD